jgi:hypothetical protein
MVKSGQNDSTLHGWARWHDPVSGTETPIATAGVICWPPSLVLLSAVEAVEAFGVNDAEVGLEGLSLVRVDTLAKHDCWCAYLTPLKPAEALQLAVSGRHAVLKLGSPWLR